MLVQNFARSLQGFHRRRPFKPFEVELVSGERIQVDHPEALAFRGKGVAVYVDLRGGFTLLDHESVCSLRDLSEDTRRRKKNGHEE
ncbi:MAG: hypothetical protein SH850_19405 [Planctomycetaceae bacterium]|nr:hypothetical protein [Planctomycetaceae bacterium]